jgi:signal transduction histidine kinase
LHALSFLTLYFALPPELRRGQVLVLTLVILSWATWASSALASLLKRIGDNLGRLNAELEQNRAHLEARIAERSRDLQEAQAHLLHQEKMAAFGLLAAGIAHEVGNPLTSISSVVQILKRRDLDEYQREKLDLVSGQLERIQSTLRELVNFSRPASTLRTRVSVAEALTEALNIAKYYKRTRSQPISVELPPDLPAVLGVRDQLVQVFLNLILNAIDATATKGTIHVRAESKPSGLAVHIHDTGTGIAPEHAARLFQPYVTTKRHGTGLGLFVTRTLVQQHGGTVTFSSTFGEGATFTVQLPAEPVRPEHRAPPSP